MPGPVDELIKAVAEGTRKAMPGDGDLVKAHIARASFNREVRREEAWARLGYSVAGAPHPTRAGETITGTTSLSSLEFHTAKRVLDGQWRLQTTPDAYEADCQRAAQTAYLVKAGVRRVPLAATQARVTATEFPNVLLKAGQVMLVVYDTEKSRIVTSYYLPEASASLQVYKNWIQRPRPVVLPASP